MPELGELVLIYFATSIVGVTSAAVSDGKVPTLVVAGLAALLSVPFVKFNPLYEKKDSVQSILYCTDLVAGVTLGYLIGKYLLS